MKGKKLKRADNSGNIKKRYAEVDTKLVIILVIVGIFAVLIGISQLTNNQEEAKEILTVTTTTIARPLTCEEQCKDNINCINNCKSAEVNKIIIKKDVNAKECDAIEDKKLREICITNLIVKQANLKSDPSYCNNIKDETQRNNCVDNVIFNKALLKKDKTICQQISKLSTKEICEQSIK